MASKLNHKGHLQLVNMHASGPASQMDASALNPLGCVTRYKGNLYRYVQFSTGDDTVASVAGAPCWLDTEFVLSTDTFLVTSDYSNSLKVFAGVLLKATITTLYYVWIQVAGVVECVVNDDTSVKGDRIFAGTDATFTRLAQGAAGLYGTVGVMLEDRSAVTAGKADCLIYPKMAW